MPVAAFILVKWLLHNADVHRGKLQAW